eukprot:3664898-Pleurochrysis_carterae.AAC.1
MPSVEGDAPPGFSVVGPAPGTPGGNHRMGSDKVLLTVRTEPIGASGCAPITAVSVVSVDRGETPPPQHTLLRHTFGGERASLSFARGRARE